MLSIHLLGTPQILRDAEPLTITRKKSRALIYYLAASNKPLTRNHLLSFFWPDADRSAAQQTLRTTLHGLRQSIGGALIADDSTIALAADVQVDAKIFEAQLTHPTSNFQSLTSTLELYRGDFLVDFNLNDASGFDNWIIGQQEYYRRLAVRGYIALAQQHETHQNYAEALAALDQALAFDQLQEDLQRTALRLHYLAGDRAGAIRRYENLRKLLDAEMGVPPMAETRAMYDAIIKDKLSAVSPQQSAVSARRSLNISQRSAVGSQIPFTGRSNELKQLRELSSSHQLAVIEGEPGIGKTRLIDEFIASANGINLIGAARELEHALPYQPIIEALRNLIAAPEWPALHAGLNLAEVWRHEAARLLPELTETRSPRSITPIDRGVVETNVNDESTLWEGVHQFLIALSQQRSIIFFIDDLQWADASTLGLLGYLVRGSRAANASIFFMATTRPIDARSPSAVLLHSLTREGLLARIALARLTANDIHRLAQQLSPKFVAALADWLTRSAEGNPYILAELVRYLRASDLLKPDGSLNVTGLSASPIVPQTVYSLIQSRLAKLSDAAQRVLDVAVAIGRDFDFEVAARAAALSENAALDAIDELRSIGLIIPKNLGGSQYTFDHSLTMEVDYREVGEPRHRLLHRRVAEALESLNRNRLDSVAGLLAWHFGEGNDPNRAAPYALRAAHQAVQIAAWQEAIEFYKQALEADLDDQQRESIWLQLGEAYFRTDKPAQATEAYRAALTIAEKRGGNTITSRLALGRSLINQARFAEAIDLAKQVLDIGGPEDAANAELLWGSALSIEGADLIGAAEHLTKARALLTSKPDPVRFAQIDFEQGNVAAQLGDLPRAIDLYRATIDLADRASDTAIVWRILGRNNLAYHLLLTGDPGAIEYAREGLRIAQEQGALFFQPFLYSTLGEIALAKDDLDQAEKYFNEGLALAERTPNPERIAGLTANLGLVAKARGDTALAIHHLSTALARADALGVNHLAAQIRLWLVPLLPPQQARAYLAEARGIAEGSGRKRLLDDADRLAKQL